MCEYVCMYGYAYECVCVSVFACMDMYYVRVSVCVSNVCMYGYVRERVCVSVFVCKAACGSHELV